MLKYHAMNTNRTVVLHSHNLSIKTWMVSFTIIWLTSSTQPIWKWLHSTVWICQNEKSLPLVRIKPIHTSPLSYYKISWTLNSADRTSKLCSPAMSVNVTLYLAITSNFYVKLSISPPKNECTYGSPRFHKDYALVYSMRSRGSLYKSSIQRSATIKSETCLEVGTVTVTVLLIQWN